MLIENVEVMVLKVEEKENKERVPYLIIGLAIIEDGTVFDITSKDLKLISKLQAFSKQVVNLDLTSNKYGLNLKLLSVN